MGTGYTRNDVSNNIADGNIINASDLDGEFDAVESAFNSSTGHTHDGTAAEGGAITVVGPVQDLVVSATEVKPKTTNTLDLGTSGLLYKDAYLQGNMYFRDTALKIVSSADGQLDIDADVELELVAPTVDIDASTALTVDTASTTFTSTLFNVTGSANITGDLDVDNININGNTIISTDTNGDINISPDGTGTVVIDTDLDVDNINVNGNTVSSTDTNGDINLSPNGTGTVVINTDLDVDNININGNTIISTDTNGNIALTPNGTGEVDISKVDIDSGAIDGTVIGANSAAAITGTTITGTSFVSSGDMTFGDSDKAIFGAGSDLQIYHDGSNSIINDAGTGSLKFQYGGTDGVVFDSSGNVIIGSGGLDVSGIGGTYTALNMRAGAGYPVIYGQTTATTTNSPAMQIVGATSGASAGGAAEFLGIIQIAAESDSSTNGAGYMNFYTGSGGGSASERMRITSSGNVGIGTVSPAGVLDVRTGGTQQVIIGNSGTYTGAEYGELLFKEQNTELARIKWNPSGNTFQLINSIAGPMTFATNGSEAMRIDSSGRVGIGTSSPADKLDVNGTIRGTTLDLRIFTLDSTDTAIYNYEAAGTSSMVLATRYANPINFRIADSEKMRIDSSGNVGIATTSPGAKLQVGGNAKLGSASATTFSGSLTTGGLDVMVGSGALSDGAFQVWDDNELTTPRFTVTREGNVGIGTSSPNLTGFGSGTNGLEIADATLAGIRLNGNAADSLYFISGSSKHWIYGKGAVPLTFSTNATERMRIDSSGQVMIGTTSAGGQFTVTDSDATAVIDRIGTNVAGLYTGSGDDLTVGTADFKQAIRIKNTTGRVGINNVAPNSNLDINADEANFVARFTNDGNNANRLGIFVQTGTDDGSGTNVFFAAYDGDGTETGQLRSVSGTFQLTDTSDERLKQDIVDTTVSGLTSVNAMRVRDFAYKRNPTQTIKAGFVAQELQTVFPSAVSYSESDSDKILSVSRERLVPVLVKAIQELSAKNDALEIENSTQATQIADLITRIAALEAN